MADTSKLNKINNYVLEKLSLKYGIELKARKKVNIGNTGLQKEFTGMTQDKKIIVQICNNSGITSGGNLPSGKLNSILAKCFLLEKVVAEIKYIYFTDKEFYSIFREKYGEIVGDIQLHYFEDLPQKYQMMLDETHKKASKEMSK